MSLSIKGAIEWWQELQPDPDRGQSGDRAALARLRRCATISEAMQEPATFRLFRRAGGQGSHDLPPVALVAGVLAHVRKDDLANPSIPRRIGPTNPDAPETALVKPLRFRRLLEAETEDERLAAFRRLAAMADQTLNVGDLCGALLNWSDNRKRRWVYDYWNAGEPTQTETASKTEDVTP